MKRFSLLATISFTGALALAQLGCAGSPSQPAANANMATPEATPDTAAIEKELLRIENDWPRVMKERDGAAVRRIEADDVFLLSWDGSVSTKEEDAKFIESGALTAESVQMNDLKVKILDKDAAVVTGIIEIKGGKIKAQDRVIDVSGLYRFVDTFARRNSEWKVIASSSVKTNPATVSASPTPKASPSAAASPALKGTPLSKPSPVAKPSPAKSPGTKPANNAKPPAAKTASTPQPRPAPAKTP
jgi:ketosteroid isomerase-like protein